MDGQIRINTSKIHGQVYKQNDKGVMYVKVHIPDLDLYINSITVRPSIKYADKGELWVQVPKFAIYGKWIAPLEFTNSSIFWQLIKDEVLRAVDVYRYESNIPDDRLVDLEDAPP